MLNTTASHDSEPLFLDAVLISWAVLEDQGVPPRAVEKASFPQPCFVAYRIRGRRISAKITFA